MSGTNKPTKTSGESRRVDPRPTSGWVSRSAGCDMKPPCTLRLPQQLLDHRSARLAKLFIAAFVEVGELVVVQAQQVQERDVQVLDRMGDFDGLPAQLVGRAD